MLIFFVDNCGGIYNASSKLGVRPSTLKKVLSGKPLSEPTVKKLDGIIERKTGTTETPIYESSETITPKVKELTPNTTDIFDVSSRRRHSMVEKLLSVYNLYKERGTLQAVGKDIGLTRERVRQLLVKGTQLGLFKYKPFDYPFLSKEKIIEDYKRFLNLNVVARRNNISTLYLHKLLTAYNLTEKDLCSIRIEGRKLRCIDEYNCVKDKLGHHPTTTELQGSKPWRYLSIKIAKLWGSFEAFREELNIPRPLSFVEATQKWREHRRKIALIARMQHLDRIRECLNTSGPMSISQIAFDCDLSTVRTRRLLGLLIVAKEVIRQGSTFHTKYCLVEN